MRLGGGVLGLDDFLLVAEGLDLGRKTLLTLHELLLLSLETVHLAVQTYELLLSERLPLERGARKVLAAGSKCLAGLHLKFHDRFLKPVTLHLQPLLRGDDVRNASPDVLEQLSLALIGVIERHFGILGARKQLADPCLNEVRQSLDDPHLPVLSVAGSAGRSLPLGRLNVYARERQGNVSLVIFFGTGRLFVVFVAVFLLSPLLLYSPGFAFLIGGVLLLLLFASALGRRDRTPRLESEADYEPSRPFAEVRSAAQDDLLALADDIRALDIDVEMPGASPQGKDAYERALELYEQARAAFDAARTPQDFEPVSHAVEEGRFAIVTAKALLEGRTPPERRPPCFFDPRHGPSVRDVEWSPPGGTPRPVPACAADAIRIEEGGTPAAREVAVGGRQVPYWDAPAYYGPWAGGFFGGVGGLLPALFFGSALGTGLTMLDPLDIQGQAEDEGHLLSGDGYWESST